MAPYSPPIPNPVMKRNAAKVRKSTENALSIVAARYSAIVTRKMRLRPRRSARRPKYNAPSTAPAI
jgi:hypothetical protein